jgi:hypothetical protein
VVRVATAARAENGPLVDANSRGSVWEPERGNPPAGEHALAGTVSVLVRVGHLRIPKIVLRQMTLQIAGVVKNSNNVDRVSAAAVDQRMPRLSDSS